MNFRFLDPAEEEMTEAARVYEDHAVGLGKRFLDEVEGCVDLLLDRPYIGRRVGKFRLRFVASGKSEVEERERCRAWTERKPNFARMNHVPRQCPGPEVFPQCPD